MRKAGSDALQSAAIGAFVCSNRLVHPSGPGLYQGDFPLSTSILHDFPGHPGQIPAAFLHDFWESQLFPRTRMRQNVALSLCFRQFSELFGHFLAFLTSWTQKSGDLDPKIRPKLPFRACKGPLSAGEGHQFFRWERRNTALKRPTSLLPQLKHPMPVYIVLIPVFLFYFLRAAPLSHSENPFHTCFSESERRALDGRRSLTGKELSLCHGHFRSAIVIFSVIN